MIAARNALSRVLYTTRRRALGQQVTILYSREEQRVVSPRHYSFSTNHDTTEDPTTAAAAAMGMEPASSNNHHHTLEEVNARSTEKLDDESWKRLHEKLLSTQQFAHDDVIKAEQCLRWWTLQRQHGMDAVDQAFALFDHVNLTIRAQAETRSWEIAKTESASFLWLEGDYPRALHLYNAILDAWRLAGATTGDRSMYPMALFERLRVSEDIATNARSYTIIMKAVTETTKLAVAPLLCEKIFTWLLEAPEECDGVSSQRSIRPDRVVLSIVLNAWAKSRRADAAERAELLFNKYMLVCRTFPDGLPNTYAYNTLLSALLTKPATSLSLVEMRHRIDRAEHYFGGMLEKNFPQVVPTNVSFQLLIFAWADYYAKGRQEQNDMTPAIDRASALLERLLHLYLYGGIHNEDLAPQPKFFGKIISALATSQPNRQELARAEKLYLHMQRLHTSSNNDHVFAADVHTLRGMVIVYCKMGRPAEAEQLLDRLEEMSDESGSGANVSHYRDVLTAWIDRAMVLCDKGNNTEECLMESVENAERFLKRLIHRAVETGQKNSLPPREFVTKIMDLWGRCKRPQRAEVLLREVQQIHEETGYDLLKPLESAFRRLMVAYSAMGRDLDGKQAQKVQDILDEVRERYYAGDDDMKPSKQAYNEAVVAWALTERPDRLDKCLAILSKVRSSYKSGKETVPPDVALYGAVMKACSRSGNIDVALDVLRQMLHDYNDGNELAAPSIGIYNMTILTCLRSKDPERGEKALRIFRSMQELQQAVKGLELEPNERTLSLMAETLAKSGNPEHLEHSRQFSKKMHMMRRQPRSRQVRKSTR